MRGRRSLIPTPEMRHSVAVAAGGGVPHLDIARALGVSRTTLTAHFRRELSQGAAARRLDCLVAMFNAAVGGRVSAMVAYLAAGSRGCRG